LPPPELAVPFPAEAQQAVGLLERPKIEFAALQYHRDFRDIWDQNQYQPHP
jgi:hypothetical protein